MHALRLNLNLNLFATAVEKEQSDYTRNRRLSAIDLTPRAGLKPGQAKDKVRITFTEAVSSVINACS